MIDAKGMIFSFCKVDVTDIDNRISKLNKKATASQNYI